MWQMNSPHLSLYRTKLMQFYKPSVRGFGSRTWDTTRSADIATLSPFELEAIANGLTDSVPVNQ